MLGHYSRDLGLFPLETAVHKMTGLSARRFKLEQRGELRAGWFADVCVFDPDTVLDVATFEQPQAMSRGIDHVLVNGAIAHRRGQAGADRAGRFLASGRG